MRYNDGRLYVFLSLSFFSFFFSFFLSLLLFLRIAESAYDESIPPRLSLLSLMGYWVRNK